ncbi:MAG: radical SAM protein, partial [Armatimonadetes bacterium]|nr:radical SAM protein [Armatimonadota bacterium]NIO75722.1 radical SAM protein [Armatimonadota bacterium]NIO96948.1 radical SAM protein [Armatimonadota bacterium]
MKIVLYKPILRPALRNSYNLSFGYIKAYLQEYSPEVEVIICKDSDEILGHQPDIIGIAASVSEIWEKTRLLLSDLRQHFDGLVILGGQHITALPETLPSTADLAVLGEGEETLREIIEVYQKRGPAGLTEVRGVAYWDNGQLIKTEPRPPLDIDSLPEPADNPSEYVNHFHMYCLSTARGCPYRCTHCVEWGFHHKVRLMSAERIFELMMKHYEETGDRHVRFLDDTVTANRRRILRLHALMKERGMLRKFSLGCVSACAHHLTDEVVQALAEMGASEIGIGIESCSPRVLRLYKGNTVTVEDFEHAIEVCTRHRVKLSGKNLFGYPSETREEMLETINFVREHSKDTTFGLWPPGYYVCQPLPGSLLWQDALNAGKVSLDMDFSRLRIDPADPYDRRNYDTPWYYGNEESLPREDFVALLQEEGYVITDAPVCAARSDPPPLLRLPVTTQEKAAMYERLARHLDSELIAAKTAANQAPG